MRQKNHEHANLVTYLGQQYFYSFADHTNTFNMYFNTMYVLSMH